MSGDDAGQAARERLAHAELDSLRVDVQRALASVLSTQQLLEQTRALLVDASHRLRRLQP